MSNRRDFRQAVRRCTQERNMLVNSDPARIGVALEWADIAAANRAHLSDALRRGLGLANDLLPDHEKITTYDSAGNVVDDGYDGGLDMTHLFLGLMSGVAGMNAK